MSTPNSVQRAVRRLELTPTQSHIVEMLAIGRSDTEMADNLGIRPATLRAHYGHIFRRLGVGNRTQLLVRVIQEMVAESERSSREAD